MATNSNAIDPRFFNLVSQIAHFFTTYGLTFTAWMFKWQVGIGVALSCVAYAALHEFWYDPRYENPATRGSDFEDFFWLIFGTLAGVGAGVLFR